MPRRSEMTSSGELYHLTFDFLSSLLPVGHILNVYKLLC